MGAARPRGSVIIIIIGGSTRHYAELFGSVTVAGWITSPYAMRYETDRPIYVLRAMKLPLEDYWPQVKSYE